jgi:hypothetical protein
MSNCPSCSSPLRGPYCLACGQQWTPERLKLREAVLANLTTSLDSQVGKGDPDIEKMRTQLNEHELNDRRAREWKSKGKH